MAFFEGGAVPLVAVIPQFVGGTTGQAFNAINSSQLTSLVNQVFQGSGQTFSAQQGQAVLTSGAQNFVNIGVNPLVSSNVEKVSGVDLGSGQNFLASTLSASITPLLSNAINIGISDTLGSAGSFGPALSSIGTSLITGAFNTVLSGLGIGGGGFNGAPGAGFSTNTFPGAGDEPKADYAGGGSYTLKDIVFSLQPANQGPQAFGLQTAIMDPKIETTLSSFQLSTAANLPNNIGAAFDTSQTGKIADMGVSFLSDPQQFWNVGSLFSQGTSAFGFGSAGQGESWTFITAPKNVSWDINNQSSRVLMFGTNNPPVVAGTKGMRELTINEALVEGFIRNVSVEGKIRALENLASYKLNSSDGFVSVPVYQFWAAEKSYGGSGDSNKGFFIIKDIRVQEYLRDLKGNSTRAMVNISLTEVPEYQVNSGRDIASKATGGAKAAFPNSVNGQATQGVTKAPETNSGANVSSTGASKAATGGGDVVIKPRTPGANNFQQNGTGLNTLTGQR